MSSEFLYTKLRENFSGVLTVYIINGADPETVIMQLLNAYAKPLLLHGIEAVNVNKRISTRIITAWNSNSIIRKVFNIKYEDVGSVSRFIEDKPLRDVIMCRQVRFLKSMSLVV